MHTYIFVHSYMYKFGFAGTEFTECRIGAAVAFFTDAFFLLQEGLFSQESLFLKK